MDDPQPVYLTYQPPEPPPPPNPRRRRAIIAVSAVWVLILVVSGAWYSWHGSPSVREQTTIARAQKTVDWAIGRVISVGSLPSGPRVVTAFTGYAKTQDCSVTPVRSGARYDREVWLYTKPGDEPVLLDQIVAGLPVDYHAAIKRSGDTDTPSLRADAGDYVALTGGVDRPGAIKIIASTGCRPLGHTPPSDPTSVPAPADRAVIDTMLGRLGITPATPVTWSTHQLPCGVRTVEAVASTHIGQRVEPLPPADAATVVRTDDLYVDASGLAVRRNVGQLTVTSTTGHCD